MSDTIKLPWRLALFWFFPLVVSVLNLTAAEFKDLVQSSKQWRRLLERSTVTRVDIPGATHTFSTREWREQVETHTLQWLLEQ